MKKLLLFIILSCPFWASAQFPFPLPLTDSLTDNRNPDMMVMDINQALMVWERSDSPDSTAIYAKKIFPSGIVDPSMIKIAGKSGVHLTNPRLVSIPNPTWPPHDTLFYIFFESDEAGNKDILYVKYDENNNIYGPYQFANSIDNEEELSVSDTRFYNKLGLTWLQEDRIMTCFAEWNNTLGQFIFEPPMQLDSGEVANPVIDEPGTSIMWEKQWNGETKVAYSVYNTTTSSWSIPIIKNKPGNNEQISPVKGLWTMNFGSFTWRSKVGNQTYLYEHLFDQFPDSSQSVSNFDIRYPGCALTPIIVKSTLDFDNFFLVYSSDSTGNREIFSKWFFFGGQNLSVNSAEDDKPQIFLLNNFGWYVYEIVVSWESFRNGHWQLYYTFYDMTGGIDTLSGSGINLSCYPNPVNDNLTIHYSLMSRQNIDIGIYNSSGVKVFENKDVISEKGDNYYQLNVNDKSGPFHVPGVYLIELRGVDGLARTKVVKL